MPRAPSSERIVVGRLRQHAAQGRARPPHQRHAYYPPPPGAGGLGDDVEGFEDQSGVVVHHDLTPDAKAQIDRIEQVAQSQFDRAEKIVNGVTRTAYVLAGVLVVLSLIGGAVYYASRPPKKKKKKKKNRRQKDRM